MKKGFTLLEILITIAIVAILMSVLILVINPPEIFKRGNDTQRLANATTLRDGIMAYLIERGSFEVANLPCGTADNPCNSTCCVIGGQYRCGGLCTEDARAAIDGTGWIPLDFANLRMGSPFNALPLDSLNRGEYFYRFGADDGQFEVDLLFESKYFNEVRKLPQQDGGDSEVLYEVGTNLSILGPRVETQGTIIVDFTGDPQIETQEGIVVEDGQVTLEPGS